MLILWSAVCGFLLDILLGDPAWLLHPVVVMGRGITWVEQHLRPRLPQTPRGEFWAGVCLAALLPAVTLVVTATGVWITPSSRKSTSESSRARNVSIRYDWVRVQGKRMPVSGV